MMPKWCVTNYGALQPQVLEWWCLRGRRQLGRDLQTGRAALQIVVKRGVTAVFADPPGGLTKLEA